jgi:hypothetical protein
VKRVGIVHDVHIPKKSGRTVTTGVVMLESVASALAGDPPK